MSVFAYIQVLCGPRKNWLQEKKEKNFDAIQSY
jgi:hypothetical protein